MSAEAVEHEEHSEHDNAVPVKMVKTERESAPLASMFSYVLQGTEAPFQLLPRSEKRSRASISYAVALGAAGTSYAYLCRRNAVSNPVPSSSLVLQTTANGMSTVTYEGASEVWCVPQVGSQPIIITVLDEWYE